MFRRLLSLNSPAARHRLAAAAVLALAAWLRLWALDGRPPHFDEGVNGMFTDRMQQTGFYRYDPTNYHGPLHFYVLFVFKTLLGRNLWALRLPTALVSIATVAWMFRFSRFFDRRLCFAAALGLALSPASVYFGRDAIHESWLAFFLLLTLEGAFGLWRDGARGDLWTLGIGLSGMVLTKETYVIHVACFALAAGTLWVWEQAGELGPQLLPPGARRVLGPFFPAVVGFPPPAPQRWTRRDLAAVCAVCLGTLVFFYSGGFFNPGGLKGLYETFTPWIHKSQAGEGHNKPWRYWLDLLAGQEPWALAGLLAGVVLLWVRTDWRLRYVTIYAAGALTAYSLIPYKTPWCMVSIVWPFFLPAAGGLTALADRARPPWGAALGLGLLALAAAWTGFRAARLSFFHPTDDREKYVYVQTFDAVTQLTIPLGELVRENPVNYQMRGLVLTESYHPLPWMLGDFPHVGYYDHKRSPEDYRADFLVVAEDRDAEVESHLDEPYFRENFLLRPALGTLTLYLRAARFAHLMPEREPEFEPAAVEAKPPADAPAP